MGNPSNRTPARTKNREAGYTLAELLIVVSLIGLVAMIAVPTAAGSFATRTASAPTRQFNRCSRERGSRP
jgi:prepilin-type N-terminal cleavage/methylation domain-containing protein